MRCQQCERYEELLKTIVKSLSSEAPEFYLSKLGLFFIRFQKVLYTALVNAAVTVSLFYFIRCLFQ